MQKFTICIIGDDERQTYLSEYLEKEGMTVLKHPDWNPAYLEGCDLLIGPVSFYRKGELLPEVRDACAEYKVPILNYMSCREFLIANAELTAEGLLAYLILNTPFALQGSHALILGFGRCGSAIAKRLHALGCRVDAYDLVPKALEKPESYDFLVNTIPEIVLTEDILRPLRKSCLLFDIVTTPGGYDEDAVSRLGMTLIRCPAIPGKTAPKSAGYAIGAQAIGYLN